MTPDTLRARMSGTVSIKGVDPMVSETLGGNGEVGSFSEPGKAAGAGGVVTQNPRVACVSRAQVSHFSAWGCGDGGKFCDAIGSILRTPPEVWQPKVWAPMVMNGMPRWAMGRKAWKAEGPLDFDGASISPIRG
jgi:hypothetical protein